MNRNYYIEGITQDWLLKPGMVVYVEREYDKGVNDYIDKNYAFLRNLFKREGLTFLYIPKFFSLFPKRYLNYYVGKDTTTLVKVFTKDILTDVLTKEQFTQIEGPALLFTGSGEHRCHTFLIDCGSSIMGMLFESKKEKRVGESIHSILYEARGFYGKKLLDADDDTAEHQEKRVRKTEEKRCGETTSSPISEDAEKRDDGDMGIRFRTTSVDRPLMFDQKDLKKDTDLESDACEKAKEFVRKLLKKGYSKETIWALLAPLKELSMIIVTVDYRILLPIYNMEILLPPVQKALYLLFLRHPEGIYFKDMPDYQHELFYIYRKIAVRGGKEKHEDTIAELVNPLSNSMNEKCSNIKRHITTLLDDDLAKHYYISGGRGELKKIDIDEKLIVWEGM